MKSRASIALCLAFRFVLPAEAQDLGALDALFRQAAERETGSAKDYAGASGLYAEAARQGHTPSMVRLGYLLQSGVGVPANPSRALELFTQAAKAGNLDGQFMLALTYLHGVGTNRNLVAARQSLLQPAGANHQYAQYLLGVMLENGEGGDRREAAARRWLDRAAAGPDQNLSARAADLRDKIDKKLLAPDNSAGIFVSAVLLMAIVGVVAQGNAGRESSSSSSSSGPWLGGGSSSSTRPCRPVPIPMVGTAMTPNGRALSNPGVSTIMSGC